MTGAEIMRRALEAHDVVTCCRLWAQVAPYLPQPKDELEARITMHYACTVANNIAPRSRYYSHRWLLDHGKPSGLPDELKPKAERMFPKIVDAIGIACGVGSAELKPLEAIMRGAMEIVVLEHYAEGIRDPAIIKPRMLEAKKNAIRKLFGK